MSKCLGDPCAAGLCKGRCSTGKVEAGPMLVRLWLPFHNHETSGRRSAAFRQTHYLNMHNHRKTTDISGYAVINCKCTD